MKQQKCIWCEKETTTPSHSSRKKKYCNNSCQLAYERDKGLRFKLPPISKEDLQKLYFDDKLSCKKIADKLGVSIKQVSRFLKRYEIPAREFSTKGLTPRKGATLTDDSKSKIRTKALERVANGTYRSPGYIDGRTPKNKAIRETSIYKLWRKSVFVRDDYTCVLCEAKSSKGKRVYLNADHIKPFSKFPELRFAIDNGRTLCIECHRKTDTFGGKMRFWKS